jgi:hypothetical protein
VNASDEIALMARPSASTATQLVVSPAIPVGGTDHHRLAQELRASPRQLLGAEERAPGVVVGGTPLVAVPERAAGRQREQVHGLGAGRRQSGQEPVEEPACCSSIQPGDGGGVWCTVTSP